MAHRRDTTARRQELFEEAAAIIAFEYAEPLTLDEVARRLFTSPRQLQRAFAEAGDGSFRSHLCRIRMERASDLLRDGAKVAEAAHAVGYSQPAQFAKAFRRYRPLSPSAVRHRHAPAARMAETRPRRSSASSSKPTPSRHSSRGISTLAPPIVAKDSARVSHPWGRKTLLASAGSRPIEVSRAPALGTSAQMEAVAPEKLQSIEHIVVLQLENRSFDHMLGYLALAGNELPAHGELDNVVNGFGGEPNSFKGVLYPPEPLDEDAFDRHDLDPPHGADEVERQIAGGTMSGFVEEWARKLHKKSGWTRWAKRAWAKLRRRPYPDPAKLRAVVGYVTREKVPVFDHLARHFCVCDNWFCAVPGPTMPNRFFSVAGTHDGEMSNVKLLVHKGGSFKSLFRELHSPHAWRWYSSDPGILRAIDEDYRLDTDPRYDHFAYFDEFTERQPRTFLSDVLRDGELPEVAWIDPNFAIRDMVKLIGPLLDGPGSNDDHPPSRVIEAQRLVNKVYEALGRSRYWDNTLFVTYYDEHGGFHDHQEPPAGMGPRIPALLVGGRVKRGVFHKQLDHASLIKTILLRFGTPGSIGRMPERVAAATDLSGALRDDNEVVPFRPLPNGGPVAITEKDLEPRMLEEGASRATRTIEFLEKALTDLQALMVKYHALPLRTGRRTLSRLPTRRLAKLAIEVAPDKPEKERLPPRRP